MPQPAIYRVTASALNLRALPARSAARLAVLQRDAIVRRVTDDALDPAWLRIVWQNREGFAAREYLQNLDGDSFDLPAAAPQLPPAPPVESRDRSMAKLHPVVRDKVEQLLARTHDAAAPFHVFETFRTPERQNSLYASGRTQPGPIVTRARAWQSPHQYGVAADIVLFINNQWSWETRGALAHRWTDLHTEARALGLTPLSFELPHVELAGFSWEDMLAGTLPPDGDETWYEAVSFAAARWKQKGSQPAGPDLPIGERPALPTRRPTPARFRTRVLPLTCALMARPPCPPEAAMRLALAEQIWNTRHHADSHPGARRARA